MPIIFFTGTTTTVTTAPTAFQGMTFKALWGDQLDIELASSDRSQLFTAARRKKAVNDAMHNFERITRVTQVFGTIPIVSGVGEYDLLLNVQTYISLADRGEPAIKMVDPAGKVSYLQGENFPRRTPFWLDQAESGWRAAPSGTPTSWYLRDDGGFSFIGAEPAPLVPAGWTYTWLIPMLVASDDMVNDGDKPWTINGHTFSRLATYEQALVHYAAGVLEPARKNYAGAQRQMGLYAGFIAQYETKERRDGTDQVVMARNYYGEAQRAARAEDPRR